MSGAFCLSSCTYIFELERNKFLFQMSRDETRRAMFAALFQMSHDETRRAMFAAFTATFRGLFQPGAFVVITFVGRQIRWQVVLRLVE